MYDYNIIIFEIYKSEGMQGQKIQSSDGKFVINQDLLSMVSNPAHKDLQHCSNLEQNSETQSTQNIMNVDFIRRLATLQQNIGIRYWMQFVDFCITSIQYRSANACLLYHAIKLQHRQNQNDLVSYTILKIYELITIQHKKASINQQSQDIQASMQQSLTFYKLLRKHCNFPESSLYQITQLLCRRYCEQQLSILALETAYTLLDAIQGQQTEPNSFDDERTKPLLYFNGSGRVGVKIILTNNKWSFEKYMHLCCWMKVYNEGNEKQPLILNIKTSDHKCLRVIQERSELAVQCVQGKEISYRKVCDLPINAPFKLSITLQSKEEGLFKSPIYLLHIGIDNQLYHNIQVKIPKFNGSSYITDFNLLQNFYGILYATILSKSLANFPYLCNQQEVDHFCRHLPQSSSIVTILSPLKVHQGILINQYNSRQNHGCHSAAYVLQAIDQPRRIAIRPDISLVFLYFCACVYKHPAKISAKDRKILNKLYNKILTNFCLNLFTIDNYLNGPACNKQLSNLFILYFLELTDYPINQATLNIVIDCSCVDSYSGTYLIRYLDFNGSITAKFLNPDKALAKHYKNSQNGSEALKKSEVGQCNPVSKSQLLFLLETQWKKLWNKLQYSSQWWIPSKQTFQNNKPFDQNAFFYDAHKKQGDTRPLFEWSVSEFVTNDFCDCLLFPDLKIPNYGNFTNYQQAYVKKQCMSESFNEPDIWRCLLNMGKGIKNKRYGVKPIEKSIFRKLKQKIAYTAEQKSNEPDDCKVDLSMPARFPMQSGQYYEAPVCRLDKLTLVIGTICIRTYLQGQIGTNINQLFNKTKTKHNKAIIGFYPKHQSQAFDHICIKSFKQEQFRAVAIRSEDIKWIRKRRYNQSMNGIEIKLKSGISHLFYFYETLKNHIEEFFLMISPGIIPQSMVSLNPYDQYLNSNFTMQWIDKQISNYEYLQHLNDISGRSYADVTQYPMIPWVFIGEEDSNLVDPHNYRNLTKNMGSLGSITRKMHFMQKFQNKNEDDIFNQYHFGTHYSSSPIVFNFLIRLQPYSNGAITLQSGEFDCADRVFSSYLGSWKNAISSNTDIRQLVPEIYFLPQMFINTNNYDFGFTQTKQKICNVRLPQWSENDPYRFCSQLKRALQSQETSQKIKNWIDLIYGYKQKGKEAVNSVNIFFPLTYQLAINVEKIIDPGQRISIEAQIAHFGQNPAQILGSSPHPDKITKKKWQNKLIADCNDMLIQRCNLDESHKIKQEQPIYQSVYEDKSSVLAINFISDTLFIVLRRHQFMIFKIIDQEAGFITKQSQTVNDLEKQGPIIDYPHIEKGVPIISIHQHLVIFGGFCNGYLQILFLKDLKSSATLKLAINTITALGYVPQYQLIYVGDCNGNLGVYSVSSTYKDLTLQEEFYDRIHSQKINNISLNYKANMAITCSMDGSMKVMNLYSQQIYKIIYNPARSPVLFATISTSPLYSIIFYSKSDSKIYIYSINGQYLSQIEQPTVQNLRLNQSSDYSEYATLLNGNRQICIYQLPYLKQKKRIRLKKDKSLISAFEVVNRMAIAGSQAGNLQIVANPGSF